MHEFNHFYVWYSMHWIYLKGWKNKESRIYISLYVPRFNHLPIYPIHSRSSKSIMRFLRHISFSVESRPPDNYSSNGDLTSSRVLSTPLDPEAPSPGKELI